MYLLRISVLQQNIPAAPCDYATGSSQEKG